MLAGYGLLAALANVLIMYAAQHAPAAVIGPTQYSQMLWAILFGYLIFGDRVDGWMLVGIALIVGSGLLTLMREKQRNVPLPNSVAASDQNVTAVMLPEERTEADR